jgi:hypothetical protein
MPTLPIHAAVAIALTMFASMQAQTPDTPGQEKKVVEYGWDCPNTAYLRAHFVAMEKHPFDGLVIQVTKAREPRLGGNKDTLGFLAFGKYRLQSQDYLHAIEDLQATKFARFTDNFIQVISLPGIDWFDPEWDAVAHNATILARIAKRGGCVGLMFDAEEYQQKMWTSSALPELQRAGRSKEQLAAKVRQRGAEFMRAINGEFPEVKILLAWGPATSLRDNGRYDLLAPFVDGMAAVATPSTQLIDGYEQAYGYKDRVNFEKGRTEMKVKSRELFKNKAAFDRIVRSGFGLWLDYNSARKPWGMSDFSTHHFSPDQFENAVRSALDVSDRYVWIYSERLNWWTGEAVPPPYLEALRRARSN